MPRRSTVVLMASIAVALLGCNAAQAHDLRGKVKIPPDAVIVEAAFSDDTPAGEALVTITDAQRTVIAKGRTDDRGICSLPPLPPGSYTAVVESIGHRDAIDFQVSAGSEDLEFTNPRLNAALGLGIGVAILLAGSGGYWLARRRAPANKK